MTIVRLILAAALVGVPFAASAGLVDGSFEIKGAALPVTDYCYDGFATPGGPACAPGAWIGNGVIKSGSGPWGGTTTADGSYFGFVQGNSTLSQTFTADVTSTYDLSWLDAGRTNDGGPQSYTVTILGAGLQTLGTFTTNGGPFTTRSDSTLQLVAGNSYTLSFTGLVAEDRTSFIDGVALTAVPEPATWGLMLAGFAMVGAAARRRSRALAA